MLALLTKNTSHFYTFTYRPKLPLCLNIDNQYLLYNYVVANTEMFIAFIFWKKKVKNQIIGADGQI